MANNPSLAFIMEYEQSEDMPFEDMIAGFQALINCGVVWSLQGHYGRTAQSLINQGHCSVKPPPD